MALLQQYSLPVGPSSFSAQKNFGKMKENSGQEILINNALPKPDLDQLLNMQNYSLAGLPIFFTQTSIEDLAKAGEPMGR